MEQSEAWATCFYEISTRVAIVNNVNPPVKLERLNFISWCRNYGLQAVPGGSGSAIRVFMLRVIRLLQSPVLIFLDGHD